MVVTVMVCAVALAAQAGVRWWNTPAPVPDQAAPFVATQPLMFAGRTVLSQRITPRRDRLRAIDLIISAENANLPGEIEVRVLEWPSGQELRLSRRPAADAPPGNPWRFRPGQPDERWLAFGFDPVPDSAGRELSVTLAYPQGEDRPGARLGTLAHFPGRPPLGNLAVNGDPREGNLLFRLAAGGTRGEALRQAGDNLARQQPYFPTRLVLPAALAALCCALAAGLTISIALAGGTRGAGGQG